MFEQLVHIIANPPGSLVYHLGLAVFIAAALQVCILNRPGPSKILSRRPIQGLAALLAGQLILLLAVMISPLGFFDGRALLPPLERAVTLLSSLWIVWLWLFPNPNPKADAAIIALHGVVLMALAGSISAWIPYSTSIYYRQTWLAPAWELSGALSVLIGSAILAFRRSSGWISGLAVMVILLIGILLERMAALPVGNFSGSITLAQLAAYPFLAALPSNPRRKQASPTESAPRPATQERRRFSTDARTLNAFLALAIETSPSKLCFNLTRLAAHLVIADLSYLVEGPSPRNQIILRCGFDLIREAPLPGTVLPASEIPQISSALSSGSPLRLVEAGADCPDLVALSRAINLPRTGHLLLIPLLRENGAPAGGIMLLSAYSGKVWSLEDQKYLSMASRPFATLLERGRAPR